VVKSYHGNDVSREEHIDDLVIVVDAGLVRCSSDSVRKYPRPSNRETVIRDLKIVLF